MTIYCVIHLIFIIITSFNINNIRKNPTDKDSYIIYYYCSFFINFFGSIFVIYNYSKWNNELKY